MLSVKSEGTLMRKEKNIDQLSGLRNAIARDKQDWRSRINLFLGVAALAAAILGLWWI